MSQITVFDDPGDTVKTVAQLATQIWFNQHSPTDIIMAWDKKKRANELPVTLGDIDVDKMVVEYPTVLDTEEGTFTSTIILSEKDRLFIRDAHIPYLSPHDYMTHNEGVAVLEHERLPGEVGLEDVISLATLPSDVPLSDYLFVQAEGGGEWLLLLSNQHTLYTPGGLLTDLFGTYFPWSASATLKNIDESRLTHPPETLDEIYVGSISVREDVVPTLTTINIVNLPLLADVYRDHPLNYDGQITYDGSQTYSGEMGS